MGQDALSAVSDGRHASSGQEERHVGRDHGREEATDMPQRRAAALLLPQSGREKMMGTFKKEAEDHLGALPRVSLERALRWSDLPKACLPLTWGGLVQLSGSGLMTGCLGCLTCPTPIRRGAAVRSSAAPQRGCLANLISSCVAQERGVHKISFNKAPCQCAGVQNSLQFDRILTCRNRSLSSSEHSSNHSQWSWGARLPNTTPLFLARRPLVKRHNEYFVPQGDRACIMDFISTGYHSLPPQMRISARCWQ
jgi:hypothetical protein